MSGAMVFMLLLNVSFLAVDILPVGIAGHLSVVNSRVETVPVLHEYMVAKKLALSVSLLRGQRYTH